MWPPTCWPSGELVVDLEKSQAANILRVRPRCSHSVLLELDIEYLRPSIHCHLTRYIFLWVMRSHTMYSFLVSLGVCFRYFFVSCIFACSNFIQGSTPRTIDLFNELIHLYCTKNKRMSLVIPGYIPTSIQTPPISGVTHSARRPTSLVLTVQGGGPVYNVSTDLRNRRFPTMCHPFMRDGN